MTNVDSSGTLIIQVNDPEVKTTYQHVDPNERLESTCYIPPDNLAKSSNRYRTNYNKGDRRRHMNIGG